MMARPRPVSAVSKWHVVGSAGGEGSQRRNDQACVKLAKLGGHVGVRDPKNRKGGRLDIEREPFVGLLERLKRGGHSLSEGPSRLVRNVRGV